MTEVIRLEKHGIPNPLPKDVDLELQKKYGSEKLKAISDEIIELDPKTTIARLIE